VRATGLILLCLGFGLAPAAGQAPPVPGAADRAAISACLRDAAAQPRACIGGVAVACVRATVGDRRDAEVACARREQAVWRERLDVGAQAVARGLEAGQRARFAALQRSWESYTAEKCAFFGEVQPVARAAGLQAGCDLRETAERAVEIARLLAQRSRRPASSPPQIIR